MAEIQTDEERVIRKSFRFGEAIARAASSILRTLGETNEIIGNEKVASEIVSLGEARAVLARTNTMVIREALAALGANRSVHIVGGTDELKRLVGDVFNLKNGQPASHPDFFGFSHWDEVVAFAATEEGEDLMPFVALVEQHGAGALWACIRSVTEEENEADVVLSTAHKSKGREWPSVKLASDFSASNSEGGPVSAEEVRLFYVAVTRAKEKLIVDAQLLAAFESWSPAHADTA
jgi:hypothetical protein